MKSGGGLLPSHQREELKGLRKAMGTSANQYRKFTEPTTHLAELKRMIESSKMLSKINILERTKSNGAGLIALKFDILGQYIPNDPIKITRDRSLTTRMRPLVSPLKGDFLGLDSNRYSLKTPTGTMTSRHSPVADETPKEKIIRSRSHASVAPLTTSRFHQSARLSYKKSDSNVDIDESRKSSVDGLRDSQLGKPKASHFKSKSQRFEIKDDLNLHSNFSTTSKSKFNGLFKDTQTKNLVKSPDSLHIKSKSSSKISTALPKLDKKPQKSNKLRAKRRSLDQGTAPAPDSDLSKQLNLQGDPTLNNVYSPEFFTPTVCPPSMYQNLLLSQRSESAHNKNNLLVPLYSSNT